MNDRSQRRKSRWLRDLLVFFVLATCIKVWLGPTEIVERANAQIIDPTTQRKLVLAEAARTNQLLGEIKEILAGKVLNVRIVVADNKAGASSVPPGPG